MPRLIQIILWVIAAWAVLLGTVGFVLVAPAWALLTFFFGALTFLFWYVVDANVP